MSYPPVTDCWFLTGPTAGGKTQVAVPLANRIGAEIISLDSMALYRGMDIATAKPSPHDRGGVPHHLLDILEPHEEFNVAQYVAAAHEAIDQIRARHHEVLFVGGTPLYLKALLRGIFDGPPADWTLRQRLEAEATEQGSARLHGRLAEVDPKTASRLHPNDTRRVIRALEVYELTGRPISLFQEQFDKPRPPDANPVAVLQWPPDLLARRIDRRVDRMFAEGLLDEIRQLLERPVPLSRSASQAVGYREGIDHLHGRRGLPDTVALVKTRTRQFAKRQRTWFRSLAECRFFPVREPFDPEDVARRLAEPEKGREPYS